MNSRSVISRRTGSCTEYSFLLLQLGKMKISLLATLSAATGYLLAAEKITIHILVPTASVFLLACGACAFNQYQERKIDRLMERTRSRPIPSGRLNPQAALWISTGFILLGSLILLYAREVLALTLALFAVLWYNLVYTPLKQKTAFAAVPGAIVGAIPPILGWVSAGGTMEDPRIWGIALFFFLWQIPHFWLLLLDFSKDYERAGLPSIAKVFSTEQIKRIVFVWLLSTGVSSLAIPLFGFFKSIFFYIFLASAALWLLWNAVLFLGSNGEEISFRLMLARLNSYVVLVISVLSLDKVLSP
jgi:protoheme IX farnesyltransferase